MKFNSSSHRFSYAGTHISSVINFNITLPVPSVAFNYGYSI